MGAGLAGPRADLRRRGVGGVAVAVTAGFAVGSGCELSCGFNMDEGGESSVGVAGDGETSGEFADDGETSGEVARDGETFVGVAVDCDEASP